MYRVISFEFKFEFLTFKRSFKWENACYKSCRCWWVEQLLYLKFFKFGLIILSLSPVKIADHVVFPLTRSSSSRAEQRASRARRPHGWRSLPHPAPSLLAPTACSTAPPDPACPAVAPLLLARARTAPLPWVLLSAAASLPCRPPRAQPRQRPHRLRLASRNVPALLAYYCSV